MNPNEKQPTQFWVIETSDERKLIACGGYSTSATPIFDDTIEKEAITHYVELKVICAKEAVTF